MYLIRLVREAGTLRILLVVFTVFLVLSAPFAFLPEPHQGWRLFFAEIVPAMVPPLFFVYPLDMTMCRVKMDGAPDAQRQYQKRMIRLNQILMLVLFVSWLPFYFSLLAL